MQWTRRIVAIVVLIVSIYICLCVCEDSENLHNLQPRPNGNWCSYQVPKVVSCQEPNGTESYLAKDRNHCVYWPFSRNCAQTHSGRRLLQKREKALAKVTVLSRVKKRPKYVTVYRTIYETMWKCCPGFTGPNCDIECFNCTILESMERRMWHLETKELRELRITIEAMQKKINELDGAIDLLGFCCHKDKPPTISFLPSYTTERDATDVGLPHSFTTTTSDYEDDGGGKLPIS